MKISFFALVFSILNTALLSAESSLEADAKNTHNSSSRLVKKVSSVFSNQSCIRVLPYAFDEENGQMIFLLGKGLGRWSSFSGIKNLSKNEKDVIQSLAKNFAQETLFIYGNSDYILPKLKCAHSIKHPQSKSLLYFAQVDYLCSKTFIDKQKQLQRKNGKYWLREHGACKKNFMWVSESELLMAILKAEDKILSRILNGSPYHYVKKDVYHHVVISSSDQSCKGKIAPEIIEFLSSPCGQDFLVKMVRKASSKNLINKIFSKKASIQSFQENSLSSPPITYSQPEVS